MTANETESTGESFDEVPLMLIVMMRMAALLILSLNGTVLLCLCVKIHINMPRIYTLQIICLCLTDNMAGAALLAMSFVDYDWFRTDVIRCCLLLGFFISTQSITLYNVTVISFNRFIIMMRMDKAEHHLTRAKVIVFSIAALTLGIVFSSLPFYSWRSTHNYHYKTGCSLVAVFRENFESSMRVYLGTYLIPLMITNILYGCLFCMLRSRRRRTHPGMQSIVDENEKVPTIRMRTKILQNTCNAQRSPRDQRDIAMAGPSNNYPDRQDVTLPMNNLINTSSTSRDRNDKVCIDSIREQVPAERLGVNSVSSNSTSIYDRPTHQRKAFTLLGLILLSLNLCTWPGIIILSIGSTFGSLNLSRGVIVPLFSSISFNSIINPIIYTIRITEFRKALFHTFRNSQSRFQ